MLSIIRLHCFRVDNSWFGTGPLSLLYGCLKYLCGLAITGLAFQHCRTDHYLVHPGLMFVYKTSPIFRGVLNPWRIVAPCPRPLALQEGCGKNIQGAIMMANTRSEKHVGLFAAIYLSFVMHWVSSAYNTCLIVSQIGHRMCRTPPTTEMCNPIQFRLWKLHKLMCFCLKI